MQEIGSGSWNVQPKAAELKAEQEELLSGGHRGLFWPSPIELVGGAALLERDASYLTFAPQASLFSLAPYSSAPFDQQLLQHSQHV